MDYLAVFRSRSEALKLLNALRARRIACAAVNTPSALRQGCGISIVFPGEYRETVSELINKSNSGSFVGFFSR